MMKNGDVSKVEVRLIDEETGNGLFLKESSAAVPVDASVLREAPVVFAQSYGTSDFTDPSRALDTSFATPSARCRMRCCFGCGRPLVPSMLVELQRVLSIQSSSETSLPPRTPLSEAERTAPSGAEASPVTHTDASQQEQQTSLAWLLYHNEQGEASVVCFCSPDCQRRARNDDGKRFVLSALVPSEVRLKDVEEDGDNDDADKEQETAESPGVQASQSPLTSTLHCYPSLSFIWQHHLSLWDSPSSLPLSSSSDSPIIVRRALWPTRQSALNTLHHIAAHYNERLWLIVLLLAKLLARTLTDEVPCSGDDEVVGACQGEERVEDTDEHARRWSRTRVITVFRAQLDAFVASYAEGASRGVNAGQRALLRFSWQLLTWWLYLCLHAHDQDDQDEDVAGFRLLQREGLPLQLVLQLQWLMDANVHAYVVVSPLFSWWCRRAARRTQGGEETEEEAEPSDLSPSPPPGLLASLEALLTTSSPVTTTTTTTDGSEPPSPPRLRTQRLSGIPSPEEIAPHVTGVALYKTATKLNHSCRPSVRFLPNDGPVCADVVASETLSPGAQLFTSYINLDAYAEAEWSVAEATARRQAALMRGYGFACVCPLCAGDGKSVGHEA